MSRSIKRSPKTSNSNSALFHLLKLKNGDNPVIIYNSKTKEGLEIILAEDEVIFVKNTSIKIDGYEFIESFHGVVGLDKSQNNLSLILVTDAECIATTTALGSNDTKLRVFRVKRCKSYKLDCEQRDETSFPVNADGVNFWTKSFLFAVNDHGTFIDLTRTKQTECTSPEWKFLWNQKSFKNFSHSCTTHHSWLMKIIYGRFICSKNVYLIRRFVYPLHANDVYALQNSEIEAVIQEENGPKSFVLVTAQFPMPHQLNKEKEKASILCCSPYVLNRHELNLPFSKRDFDKILYVQLFQNGFNNEMKLFDAFSEAKPFSAEKCAYFYIRAGNIFPKSTHIEDSTKIDLNLIGEGVSNLFQEHRNEKQKQLIVLSSLNSHKDSHMVNDFAGNILETILKENSKLEKSVLKQLIDSFKKEVIHLSTEVPQYFNKCQSDSDKNFPYQIESLPQNKKEAFVKKINLDLNEMNFLVLTLMYSGSIQQSGACQEDLKRDIMSNLPETYMRQNDISDAILIISMSNIFCSETRSQFDQLRKSVIASLGDRGFMYFTCVENEADCCLLIFLKSQNQMLSIFEPHGVIKSVSNSLVMGFRMKICETSVAIINVHFKETTTSLKQDLQNIMQNFSFLECGKGINDHDKVIMMLYYTSEQEFQLPPFWGYKELTESVDTDRAWFQRKIFSKNCHNESIQNGSVIVGIIKMAVSYITKETYDAAKTAAENAPSAFSRFILIPQLALLDNGRKDVTKLIDKYSKEKKIDIRRCHIGNDYAILTVIKPQEIVELLEEIKASSPDAQLYDPSSHEKFILPDYPDPRPPVQVLQELKWKIFQQQLEYDHCGYWFNVLSKCSTMPISHVNRQEDECLRPHTSPPENHSTISLVAQPEVGVSSRGETCVDCGVEQSDGANSELESLSLFSPPTNLQIPSK